MMVNRILLVSFLALASTFSLQTFAEKSLVSPSSGTNKVEYFAEFYSYEGKLGLAATTHTFGRFVKTINGKPVEKVDISWLPKEESVSSLNRMPLFTSVPGKNFSLEDTFLIANNKTITNHGKYSIAESLFENAKGRKTLLDSGKIPYKFLATANSDDGVNCIHALMGTAGDIPTGIKSGIKATEAVIDHFLKQNLMAKVSAPTQTVETSARATWSKPREITKNPVHTSAEENQTRNALFPRLRSLFNKKK